MKMNVQTMKTTKRILSLLLSLLLALMLLVLVAAEEVAADIVEDAEVDATIEAAAYDPYAPVITKQPKGGFLKAGKNMQLKVEARLPDAGGELSYAWYEFDGGTLDYYSDFRGNGPVYEITTQTDLDSLSSVPRAQFSPVSRAQYCAVVTNTYVDGEGVQRTASVKSKVVDVKCYLGYFSILKELWTAADFPGILSAAPLLLGYSFLYTLIYPFILIGLWIV